MGTWAATVPYLGWFAVALRALGLVGALQPNNLLVFILGFNIGFILGFIWGLYWDNGKENGNYYNRLYRV